MDRYLWDAPKGAYLDYHWTKKTRMPLVSAATLYPLFVSLASKAQAVAVAKITGGELLKAGGIVTTTLETGQQWDSPNGWAPLQWIAISGLRDYGQTSLAATIACRWMANVNEVYRQSGKLVEKYDVVTTGRSGGGGKLIELYPADADLTTAARCPSG
jgi:alpha,alpha-trehalase